MTAIKKILQKNSFIECLCSEMKYLFRGKGLLLIVLAWFILLVLFCMAVISVPTHIGDSFTTSGWVTQILIFAGMSIGALLASRDHRSWCEETLIAIPKVYKYKIFSRMIILLIITLALVITSVLSVFFVFLFKGAPGIYYLSSAAYIVLYWTSPFIISGLLGMFLGQVIRSKFIYVLMVLTSLILGPLIPLAVGSIALSSHGPLFEYYMLFTIGQLDPNGAVYEAYGYTLNNELWLMRFLQLSSLLFLLVFTSLKHDGRRKKILRTCLWLAAISLWGISVWGTNRVSHLQLERYRYNELNEYYINNPESVEILTDKAPAKNGQDVTGLPYTIEEYRINIDDGSRIYIKTEISCIINNTDKIIFSLFHGFEVKNCSVDGVKKPYEQVGDSIVIYNEGMYSGTHSVLMEYSGLPPANLYKDEDKWILPAGFAWIPVEHIGKVMENETNINAYFSYPQNKKDVPISVRYNGNNTVYCSLNDMDENYWTGYSGGATLFCGWFDSFKYGSAEFIYPAMCPENPDHAQVFYDRIKESYPVITEELLGERRILLADKVFITASLLYLHAEGRLFIYNDHIIACLTEDYTGRVIENMSGLDTVRAIVQSPGWEAIGQDYIYLFLDGYMESMYKRGKYAYNDYVPLSRLINNAEETGNNELADICRDVQKMIDYGDSNKQISFFRDYLELLNNGTLNEREIRKLIAVYGEKEQS
jgi:hypothetical protein